MPLDTDWLLDASVGYAHVLHNVCAFGVQCRNLTGRELLSLRVVEAPHIVRVCFSLRLRACSRVSASIIGSARSGSTHSNVSEQVAHLEEFTQKISKKSSNDIYSAAKRVSVWRASQTHLDMLQTHPVETFAQKAANVLRQRKQTRPNMSIQAVMQALRSSTILAEILHNSSSPATPFAARQASTSSQPGNPPAAGQEILRFISSLHIILEKQLEAAKSDTDRSQVIPAMQATMDALVAVSAIPGAPKQQVSTQVQQSTSLVISQVGQLPKEALLPAKEPALKRLEPQDQKVLALVVTVLEALQNCEHPACTSLAAELSLAAISRLQRTTKAQVQMQGLLLSPSKMTSFVCSLMTLFRRDPKAMKAGVDGHLGVGSLHRSSRRRRAGMKYIVLERGRKRNARILAEHCLDRMLRRWIPLVESGRVDLNDMCAVLQVLQCSQEVEEQPVRQKVAQTGVHVLEKRRRDKIRALVFADVDRRFKNDDDKTQFHAWHYAVLMRSVAASGNRRTVSAEKTEDSSLSAFVQLAAELAAEDMQFVQDSWRLQDISAVLCAAATCQVQAHRAFSVAAILCQSRLKDMAERASIEDAAVLPQLENLVWAYAVSRRQYPYSADAVCAAAAGALQALVAAHPDKMVVSVVADLLWSLAAMWHTPNKLFGLVGQVLDERRRSSQQPLDSEVAESLAWSFMRAGMRLPDSVVESAPKNFTGII